MKTKRNARKNHMTRNNSSYTPGYNMFGHKAETHYVVLKKETAFQQILECICQLDGTRKEFTFNTSCFNGNKEELDEVLEKAHTLMKLKASMCGAPFYSFPERPNKVA